MESVVSLFAKSLSTQERMSTPSRRKHMASPTFFRWGGLALLVGSLIFAISIALSVFVPGPLGPSGPPPVWDAWIGAVGGLILLIGLPALYTVQSKSAGMPGMLGIIGLFAGIVLLAIVTNVIPAIVFANDVPLSGSSPTGQQQPPLFVLVIILIGSVLLIAGAILFGIATLRTKVFEKWAVWALMVLSVLSTLVFFLPFAIAALFGNIATILFVLLFTWFGYKLAFQTNTFVEVTAATADAPEASTSS